MNQAILKLIDKKIEMCKKQSRDSERHFWWMVALEQLKSEISSLPSDTQWIDVKERLPENNSNVIWLSEWWNYYMDTVKKYHKDCWITHWMNLPLPPKK